MGGDRSIEVATALDGANVHAPHLALFETVQALRNAELQSFISGERAVEAIADVLELEIEYWAMYEYADRVWALRHNLTAYDASYVALAERLDSPLITVDARLARAPGIRCEVVVP